VRRHTAGDREKGENIMSRSKWLLAIVASFAMAGTVSAQEAPAWTYVEGGWVDYSPDVGDSDNGGFIGGSMAIFKSFHLLGEYNWVGDYSFWNAGFGWHGLFGPSLDLFADVMWTGVEFDSNSNDFSDNGAELAAGVRWMLGKNFELKGTASWADLDDSDATFEAEGLFFLMQHRLGLGAAWELGNSDTAHLFARWNFGK
jgi:hypothetical protein